MIKNNSKFCSCGTCSSLTDRGFKIAGDMFKAMECPEAAIVIAHVIEAVALSVIAGQLEALAEEHGAPPSMSEALAVEAAKIRAREIKTKMHDFLTGNWESVYMPEINRVIEERNKRVEAERALPKGN